MSVRRPGPDDAASLLPLVHGYAFKPYRHYRTFSRQAQAAVLAAELQAALTDPEGMVYAAGGEEARAAVVARRLPWDSAFFGVPMARIDYLLGDDAAARETALLACLDGLREAGVCHVSARADVADLVTTAMLERHGFRLMDALVTYTMRPGRMPPDTVREMGRVRPLRDGEGPELVAIAEEAFRGFQGRFHLDPHLPRGRADALYGEWARACVDGHMADTVLVCEGKGERLMGFLAFRRREPVSTVGGLPVFGGGLGACRRDTPGAYAGLVRAGTLWAHHNGGVAECQTQNHNFPTIRVYEAVGARYVRAEYTLHAWLGGD